MDKPESVDELIDRILAFATSETRMAHARVLIKQIRKHESLEEAIPAVVHYMNTFVCEDGRNRALNALGLANERWVSKTMTASEICGLGFDKVRIPVSDATITVPLGHKNGNISLFDIFHSYVPGGMKIVVEVLESEDN